ARLHPVAPHGALSDAECLGDLALFHAAEEAAFDDLPLARIELVERVVERQRQVVECRFFGGMEESEIAEALGVTERTVRRDWVKARAWLYHALAERGSRTTLPEA
ncbi:MAG TPA: ECF-type sigma factor, partial [Kofleriaceae bacterium]|nr:ECF-type sigma factor [Kofleriaceae bacterium]